ncbi:hypothetical protein GGX14DRAFT_572178 [Mycena pura]|uniref:Uncharacterized protein n=1 Tax=Mycena pura TaxID=153505 RepID=A0AAD6V1E4_9AGAR|nr:hypothetical protein GGX14DRAFT_408439 [Mycena pura]KAJ7200415.1 hypothetical protein GGX14DRAFT_572178 [Mycena pura]
MAGASGAPVCQPPVDRRPRAETNSEQATVQDNYDAIVAAHDAQNKSDAAGGDDDVDDDSDPVAMTTRRKALNAAATLRNFVASVGDPYARKLEAIISTFGRQIQLEAMTLLLRHLLLIISIEMSR